MLHQAVLLAARNQELEEQLAVITKRKERKRKRFQKGKTLEYGEAADRVAASASLLVNSLKRDAVVVLQKEHYQLNVAVARVEKLGTTQEPARKMQQNLLIQNVP
jgi:hypothetical protein